MIKNYLESFSNLVSDTKITDLKGNEIDSLSAFGQLTNAFNDIRSNNGTIYLIGNGGSSGIVSHSAIDFLNACKIKAVALTDNSQITCMANDYGYENVFKQPLETLFNKGDALVAVSSSGSSKNIVRAAQFVKTKGGFLVTYSGFKDTNPLCKLGDFNFWLNSENYGKVEIGHALLLHILTDELNK